MRNISDPFTRKLNFTIQSDAKIPGEIHKLCMQKHILFYCPHQCFSGWFHGNLHCPKGVIDGLQAGKTSSPSLKWKTFSWWKNLLAHSRTLMHLGALWINKYIPTSDLWALTVHMHYSYPHAKFLCSWFSVYSTDTGVKWYMWSINKNCTGEVFLPSERDVWQGSLQDLPYKTTLLIAG